MLNNKIYGTVGEKLATKFLTDHGYKIIANNYKNKIGEIDIIAKEGNTLVFVEVKSRTNFDYGLPIQAINSKKINKIKLTAISFLKSKAMYEKISCRFDCIEVIGNQLNCEINHIKNIF